MNQPISKTKQKALQLAAKRAEKMVQREARREEIRVRERSLYLNQLEKLPGLVDASRIKNLLDSYRQSTDAILAKLLASRMPENLQGAILDEDSDGWIYGVDSSVWRLGAYEQFFGSAAPGDLVSHADVARWVLSAYPKEEELCDLFIAQYKARREARQLGYLKSSLSYWVFTAEENRMIPNFYSPVNRFLAAMHRAGAARDGAKAYTLIVT